MKYFLLATLLSLNAALLSAQNTPLTFSRILSIDSVKKEDIYDRAMVWCSKVFNSSKVAINVSDKSSGIIGGKSGLTSYYKVPKKKDSALSSIYSDYFFDWLIEIKDGKLRFSLSNIILKSTYSDYPVFVDGKPPGKVMFMNEDKNQIEWDMSKKYFIVYVNSIVDNLYKDIATKKDGW